MLHTTMALAKQAHACSSDYLNVVAALGGEDAYGVDTPIPLSRVLEIVDLSAAIWALRCVLPTETADRDRIARLFAVDCAERVLYLFERHRPNDMRPREAIGVARRFALGQATNEERDAAGSAAGSAARSAAGDVAGAASWAATGSAAWDAAWAASWAAAGSAAGSAARDAARAAAGSAARDAARSAARDATWDATWDAAGDAARREQATSLLALLNGEELIPVLSHTTRESTP